MLQFSGDTGKLFSKSVPVTIKDGYTNQCRNSRLFLTVEWQEASAAIHRQELKISLTDNNDPFFLYHLYLSEEDFQSLKSSQGLLVDFSAFPQKFIDLIEVCLSEENKSQPKFLLIFNINEKIGTMTTTSQLDIVETNPFKHLIHLSLKFVVATENVTKQYLSSCFKTLKEEKRQLESRLAIMEQDFKEKLSTCERNLENKSSELECVRKELSVELSIKESRHTRELQEEREQLLAKQREEELRTDKERREKEYNLRKEIEQLESRISCLGSLNKQLQDQEYKHDGTIRELQARVLSLEEENKRFKDSLKDYQEKTKDLQSEVRERKLDMSHQKEKIDELERDRSNKKQQLAQLQEQLDSFKKQEKSLQNELDDVKGRLRRTLDNFGHLEGNLAKANQVIEKLQKEGEMNYKKLHERKLLISRYESSISEKDTIIQIMQTELRDVKSDCKKKNSEIKDLTDSVATWKEKTINLEKDIRARDSVIKYLNRQLTDKFIMPQYVSPSNLTASPSNFGQAVIANPSGEPDITSLNNYSSNLTTEKYKSFPTRKKIQELKFASGAVLNKRP